MTIRNNSALKFSLIYCGISKLNMTDIIKNNLPSQEFLTFENMKILATFLGIFCLLVSAYPCCIGDDCESASEIKISENQDQQNDDCALCSPFISCGSCTGFIPNTDEIVTVPDLHPIPFSNLFGLTFKSVEADYAERVWQPPKQVIIS